MNSPFRPANSAQNAPTSPKTPAGFIGLTRKFISYVSGTPNAEGVDLESSRNPNDFIPTSSDFGSPSLMSPAYPGSYMDLHNSPYDQQAPQSPIMPPTGPLVNAAKSPLAMKRHHHKLGYPVQSPSYAIPDVSVINDYAVAQNYPVHLASESAISVSDTRLEESMKSLQVHGVKLTPNRSSAALNDEFVDEEITVNIRPRHKSEVAQPVLGKAEIKPSPSVPTLEDASLVLNNQSATTVVQQFDPLIPSDWMINFDSPAAGGGGSALFGTGTAARPSPRGRPGVQGQPSLIDAMPADLPVVSPRSQVKYTQRDLDVARDEARYEANKESGKLQSEIVKLKDDLKANENAHMQMKMIVDDFEKTMAKMIDDSRQEKERNRISTERLVDEKNRLQLELSTVETSFQETRLRYEELKGLNERYRKNEAAFKQTVDDLKKDIGASEQRVEAVKQHAEKKLSEANDELAKIQQQSEKEIALLKAKLQKSDLKIKALEQTIEQKKTENAELMGICDDLIKKMESHETAS